MSSSRIEQAQIRDGIVAVTFESGDAVSFHSVWLREACRCEQCRHPGSNRRIVEALTVPVDEVAESAVIAEDGSALLVTWPDGHQSDLAAEWLERMSCYPTNDGTRNHTRGRIPWGSELAQNLPFVDYASIASDNAGLLRCLELVSDLGVAIVTGMPSDRATMNALANRIGPIRASNYGTDWEIEATITPENAVYSAKGLSCHTDLPYRETPPGLQFLLCDISDAPGGASLLADGYLAAERLRVDEPELWQVLTETPVPFSFADAEYDLQLETPIIGLRFDGSYGVIRHAPGLLGNLSSDPDVFDRTYRAIKRFAALLADQTAEVSYRLNPGDLIIIDNHRVLHGRTAFDLHTGGRRHMLGCYIDNDDLESKVKVLRRSPLS